VVITDARRVGLGAGYWYNKRTGDLQSVGMSCTRHVNSALANSSARRRDFTYCSLRLHATGTDCYCVTKHHASQCLWTAGTHTLTVHQLRPQPSPADTPHGLRPPGASPSLKLQDWGLVKLPSVEDRGQTDRVATPTSAGLHRFRWPRPRQLATDGVTVKTYYYGHQS